MSRYEEVSRVLYRYARSLDDRRLDDLVDLFSENATLVGIRTVQGRAQIREYYQGYFSSDWTASAHFLANLIVDEIDESRVAATSDYFLTAVVNGRSVIGWGRYDDRLELAEDGHWRFVTRHNEIRALVDLSAGWASDPKSMLAKDWTETGFSG